MSELDFSMQCQRLAALVLVTLSATACQPRSEPSPGSVGKIELPSGDIPEGPASGTIDGKPFAVKTAVYAIDRRRGYEHVDIKLYSAQLEEPCATNDPGGPTVWLRRKGAEPLEPTTAELGVGQASPWEVHYQIKNAKAWSGNGDAAAKIVIQGTESDAKVHGELSAAFGDASHSLVAGAFVAQRCIISIDAPVRGAPALEPLKSADATH